MILCRLDRSLFVAQATAIAVALCVCGPVLAADAPSPAEEPSPAADAATVASEPKSSKEFSEEDVDKAVEATIAEKTKPQDLLSGDVLLLASSTWNTGAPRDN